MSLHREDFEPNTWFKGRDVITRTMTSEVTTCSDVPHEVICEWLVIDTSLEHSRLIGYRHIGLIDAWIVVLPVAWYAVLWPKEGKAVFMLVTVDICNCNCHCNYNLIKCHMQLMYVVPKRGWYFIVVTQPNTSHQLLCVQVFVYAYDCSVRYFL